ncbi:MAG: NAD(P)-dependent oxidoreductase [Cupriavidus necator]
MKPPIPAVGWIGVGAMGRPMCLNLQRAGHRLTVYDKDRARLEPVLAAGAMAADSPRNVAARAEVVFSTIFDDDGLRDIVLAPNGIAAGAGPRTTYIDMSTVSPAASAEVALALAEREVPYLRAPASGTVTLAASAQLSTFVSGPLAAFERLGPLLALLTAKQSYVGVAEEARVIKLLINLMVFMNTAVLGEALDFGARAGLARGVMLDAVNDSIVGCAHYRGKADKIAQRDYAPVGQISLVVKDMDLALEVARRNLASMPISALVRQSLALMQSRGLSGLDVAALADLDELVHSTSTFQTIKET